jgi:hypothetical protein
MMLADDIFLSCFARSASVSSMICPPDFDVIDSEVGLAVSIASGVNWPV